MEKIRSAGTGDAVRGGAAENAATGSHRVMIDNREKLTMTDIADIDSFDEQEIHAKLRSGTVIIKGEKLHIHMLDLRAGEAEITGVINSLMYVKVKEKGERSLLARIMK